MKENVQLFNKISLNRYEQFIQINYGKHMKINEIKKKNYD